LRAVAESAVSSLEPKQPGLRLALRIAVVLLVLVSLGVAVVSEADRIDEVNWRFSPGWLGLCLLALIAFEATHIQLWRLIMHWLGRDIPARRARAIWATTLLARYVPTSALMAVGRVALAEREGVPKRVTLASVAYELAFTIVSALAVCAYLLWRLPALEDHAWVRWLAAAVPIIGVIALHPGIFHRITDYVLARMGKSPLPLSLPFRKVFELSILYVGSFLVAGVAVVGMSHTLTTNLDAGDTYAIVASYALGYIAGVLAFVIPGSLGAREAGLALGLSAVMPATIAIAVAIALRLIQMGVEVLYAVVAPLLARSADGGR
jgi:hypothetical protein